MIGTKLIYICAVAALLIFFTPLTSEQYLALLALGLFCLIGPLNREILGEDFWGTMGQAQSQAESVQAPERVQQRTGPAEDPEVVAQRNKEVCMILTDFQLYLGLKLDHRNEHDEQQRQRHVSIVPQNQIQNLAENWLRRRKNRPCNRRATRTGVGERRTRCGMPEAIIEQSDGGHLFEKIRKMGSWFV